MIDDRRKPSAPPPAGVTDDEEPVEILAGDAAANATRRRPSRRLRVPNDPVPRRPAALTTLTLDDEPESEGRLTEPNLGVVSPSIPPPPPDASVLTDAITVPSVDPDALLGASTEPAAGDGPATATATSARRSPSSPPADSNPPPATSAPVVPHPNAVRRPSEPPPGAPRDSSRPAARVSTRPASLSPLARSSIVPPPAAVPGATPVSSHPPPASTSSSAPAKVNTASEPPDFGSGVVRQVRRKIRSVGTGLAPTRESSAPAATASTPAPERSDGDSSPPISIPVPLVSATMASDDDFVVPPVGAPVDVPPPPAVPTIELRPAPKPQASAPPADANADEGEAVEVSIEEEAEEPAHAAARDAARGDEAAADDEAQQHLQEDEDDAGPSLESIGDEEVVEEPTDEPPPADEGRISRPNPPPAPATARGAAGEASAAAAPKPPPPPTAPSRATVKEERKKRRAWWEELFNDDYFRTMPRHTPEQIALEGDFIEASLGVEKGAAVLDVACGAGRQAIEMATRGYEVIALDLSLPMLSRAADAAQDRNAKLNFLHSDMREMEFNEMFDAAYCMNTSFGYFDDEKNADVARRLHRALKSGGTLLLDVLNRDYAINGQPAMVWYEGDGCVCMEETSFNYFTSRLIVKRTMIFDDGRQREIEYSIRLYSLHELGLLLHNVGFRVVEVSGHASTPGAYFGPSSRSLIILAQKATSPATPATPPATAASSAATPAASPTAPTNGSGGGGGKPGDGAS